MRKSLVSIVLLLVTSVSASAQTVELKGDAALQFIHKYWPEAPIPGQFNGAFKCFVPAMGGEGNGEKPVCKLMTSSK